MRARTIAVGVGTTSFEPLAWAVAESGTAGGRLMICRVCPPDSVLSGRARIPMSTIELADPPLARALAAARDRLGGPRVELIVATGHVGEALLPAAASADLLVVGAPERRGWAQRRSTTHHVVQHAHCPVIVVRPVTSVARGPFAGHVVVGVDGSAEARAALEFGFAWADTHRRSLAAVHVTDHDHEDAWFDESMPETHFVSEPAGLALLADEVDPYRARFPGVAVKRALFGGPPRRGLLRAAAGAILLAVGDRGRGPAARAVLGSVSHGAVDEAPCPVAVVPVDRTSTLEGADAVRDATMAAAPR